MDMVPRKLVVPAWAAFGTALVLLTSGLVPSPQAAEGPVVPPALLARAAREGRVRVIVELNPRSGRHVPEGRLSRLAAAAQRSEIRSAAARVAGRLRFRARDEVRDFETVPYLVLDLDAAGLAALESASADIVQVVDDAILRPTLADSVPLIQGDQVWAAGYTGLGTTIAVLDSGVDSTHPFLAGKTVEEACYSSTIAGVSQSVCPSGLPSQLGPGSAVPCALPECLHGTHVAGIAAGKGSGAVSFSGVAPDAQLMAVQVFTKITSVITCGGTAPCMGAFTSDIIAGLERVYSLAPALNVVSVNMSLGGSVFSSPCDSQPYKPAIDNLRSIGVATVIAAGNNSSTFGVSSPGCISSAISVGSTDKANRISWFSNIAPFVSLLAPGEAITSSIPGGGFQALSGTSMATPHVAGTWGLLREAVPTASVGTILNALRQTGLPIADTRPGGTATVPRISVFEALSTLAPIVNPQPVVTALSPTSGRSGQASLTLALTGSGFDGFSVVRWNGSDRLTTVVNTTTIQAAITAADLVTVGTAAVTVFTPAPGGGTSSALTFTITPGPTLSVSASTVAPGASVTVNLANGFGGAQDWLALASVGSPNTSIVGWTYVGANVTTRSWSVAMPATAGTYEFRLFPDNGYTRIATSPPVVVEAGLTPSPVVTSLSPSRTLAGAGGFTLSVIGSKFVASSVVLWNGQGRATTFISATEIRAAIGAADVAAIGTAQVVVRTPSPGGGTSESLTFSIDPPPSLSPGSTTVPGGTLVTLTLTGAPGGPFDWLAMAPVGAPDTSYLQWTYVGAGVSTRGWTVTAPSAAGIYEFRLYLNNGYTRAATSAPITVTTGMAPTLAVSATTAAGGSPVTVTLSNGPGGGQDWIALAPVGAPETSYLQWTYVGAGIVTRTWTTPLPATVGSYEFRLYLNGSHVRAATSPAITVSADASVLTVNTTTAVVGGAVTVTLTGGGGGVFDWLALAAVGTPNTSYLQFVYVGGGVTTKVWTVTMPAAPGAYEFRLFLNNGYTRAATSAIVTTVAP
jgi:subtilisin family serine protease